MKSLILSSVFLFFTFNSLSAQKKLISDEIDLDSVKVNFKYKLPFHIGKVYDLRSDKTDSILDHTVRKKRYLIYSKTSLDSMIMNYVSKSYIGNDSLKFNIGLEKIACLPKTVYEGKFFLKLSFFKPVNSFDLKGEKMFEIETSVNNFDVSDPNSYSQKLQLNIHQALVIFNEFLNQNMTFFDKKNQHQSGLNKGLYFNRDSFLENHPYFSADVEITPKQKDNLGFNLYNISFKDKSLKKSDISDLVWGYCDGKNQYYSIKNYQNTRAFAKIEYKGKDFIIVHHNENHKDHSVDALQALGLIAGILTGYYYIQYIENYKGKLIVDFNKNQIIRANFRNLMDTSSDKKFIKS
ncbi:hypothetical protein N9X09_03490 [Flavobacteriaceae bacterium]|nr:hypothetical protein [Flavobacteriaceae bacterium]